MPGINPIRTSLQPRDQRLLEELHVCRVVDREQAKDLAGFTSTTRVNTRLLKLTHAGLLKRFFIGNAAGGTKALYTLTAKGAAVASVPYRGLQRAADSLLIGDQFVEHQLSINRVYITLKFRAIPVAGVYFLRWVRFPQEISKAIPLAPDGYGELAQPSGVLPLFLEVDHGTESSRVWDQKTSLYLRLATSGEFTRIFQHSQFRVLVITLTERRMESLRRTVRKHTSKVFWFRSFESIDRDGFWSTSWLRPEGDQKHSLL